MGFTLLRHSFEGFTDPHLGVVLRHFENQWDFFSSAGLKCRSRERLIDKILANLELSVRKVSILTFMGGTGQISQSWIHGLKM